MQGAVDALKSLSLAFESSGSRVTRYEHNLGRVLGLPSQSVALLATLMLRGAADRVGAAREQRAAAPLRRRLGGRRLPRRAGGARRREGRAAGRQAAARAGRARAALGASAVRPGRRRARCRSPWTSEAIVPASELAALKARLAAAETEVDAPARRCVDRLYAELDIEP